MNFALKTRNLVSKNEELCIKNDEFRRPSVSFLPKVSRCRFSIRFVIRMMNFVSKTRNWVVKNDEFRIQIPLSFLINQFWEELLSAADIDPDGRISREEWSSVGAGVFVSAKRAGRVGFSSSIVDMTMLLKGTTTARHMVAVISDGKVVGTIDDTQQVDTSTFRECMYCLVDPSAPGRIFREMSQPDGGGIVVTGAISIEESSFSIEESSFPNQESSFYI